MVFKLIDRFLGLNVYLKIILIFCVWGAFASFFSLVNDVRTGGVLLRLHFGFFVLYASQIIFILMRERMVFVLSLLQVMLAFITNADFTFVPVLRVFGFFYYVLNPNMTIEQINVYKYLFMSLCVTLELLKTYLLFVGLTPPRRRKTPPQEVAQA